MAAILSRPQCVNVSDITKYFFELSWKHLWYRLSGGNIPNTKAKNITSSILWNTGHTKKIWYLIYSTIKRSRMLNHLINKFDRGLDNRAGGLTHSEAETKWMPFCSQHFQIHFLVWKLLFLFKLYWPVFWRAELTLSQPCFKPCLGPKQATSHFLNQWWHDLLMHIPTPFCPVPVAQYHTESNFRC